MSGRVATVLYLAALVVAVPWYWPAATQTLWLGLPVWVAVAIAVSAAVSILTAVLLARPWPDESPHDDD